MKKLKIILILLIAVFFITSPALAVYNALMFPKFMWRNGDNTGPAAGWLVYTYAAGTDTARATYKTPTGTANANPVVLDSDGLADIYLDSASTAYKIVLKDADGVTQWTLDNVEGAAISSIVASIAATVAAIGTGSTDSELIMIAATTNNFYTWDDDNSKWRVKSGGIFPTASMPSSATYTIETGTTVFDSTLNQWFYWTGAAWANITSFAAVTATGEITGLLDVITSAAAISLSAAQTRGNIIIMTAAGDVELPDVCDTATGANVLVFVRDVAETVSIAVIAPEDTIIYPGLALDADDELDSPGDAGDWVSLVCMEANKWYVVGSRGSWTDGGVAD